MIYTIEYDYSQGLYEADWVDVLKRTGLSYKTLFHDCSTGDDAIKPTNYIFQNIKDIDNSVGSNDYLLIDSAYIFQHEEGAPDYKEVCKFIDDNIDCKKVIIFHPDIGIGRHENDVVCGKVEAISPIYYLDESADESKNRFNMYVNNTRHKVLVIFQDNVFINVLLLLSSIFLIFVKSFFAVGPRAYWMLVFQIAIFIKNVPIVFSTP